MIRLLIQVDDWWIVSMSNELILDVDYNYYKLSVLTQLCTKDEKHIQERRSRFYFNSRAKIFFFRLWWYQKFQNKPRHHWHLPQRVWQRRLAKLDSPAFHMNVYRFKDRSTMLGESPRAGYSFLLLHVQREPSASARNIIATCRAV